MRWPVAPVPRTSIESRSGSQAATLVASGEPLVENVQTGNLADLLAGPCQGLQRPGEQLLPPGGGETPGGVEGGRQQRVRAGRLDQGDGPVDDVLVDLVAVAEVEDRRLGQAADDLVGAGEDEVGAAAKGALRQRRVEVEVGAPGLVDDQRDVARVGDFGELLDPSHGAEVGR